MRTKLDTRRALTVGAVAVVCGLAFTWPALWNGFPILFGDSQIYIRWAYDLSTDWIVGSDRHWWGPYWPPFYSVWLRITSSAGTLWISNVLQVLTLVYTMRTFTSLFFPRLSNRLFCASVIAVACLTSISFYTSAILADFATPVVILSFFILLYEQNKTRLVIVGCIAFFWTLCHMSHYPLMLGLGVLSVIVSRLLTGTWQKRHLALSAAAVVPFLVLSITNWFSIDRFGLMPGNTVSMVGLHFDRGLLEPHLREHCAEKKYVLCDQLPELAQIPKTGHTFQFHDASPLYTPGLKTNYDELGRLAQDVIIHNPAGWAVKVVEGVFVLVFHMRFDKDIIPPTVFFEDEPFNYALSPADEDVLWTARQFTGPQPMRSVLHVIQILEIGAVCLALVVFVALGWRARRNGRLTADRPTLFVALMVPAAILLNALITGGLNAPEARYHARVEWLLPWLCACTALVLAASRRDNLRDRLM